MAAQFEDEIEFFFTSSVIVRQQIINNDFQ